MSVLQSPAFKRKHAAYLATSAQMRETFAQEMAHAGIQADMDDHATATHSVEDFVTKVCIGVLPEVELADGDQDDHAD